jgi:hypothetical protein
MHRLTLPVPQAGGISYLREKSEMVVSEIVYTEH